MTDLTLQVGSFKTFDMLAQGTYRLRIAVFEYDGKGQRIDALPYHMMDNRFTHLKLVQRLYESTVDTKRNTVCTSSFFIRYCDQECMINQTAVFRFAIESPPIAFREVFVEVELLGLEVGEEKNAKTDKKVEIDSDGFSTLTKAVLKVRNVNAGIHEYVPLVFGEYMFSYADFIIHSTVLSKY